MAAERRRVDEKVRSWRMLVATAPSIMDPTQRRSHRIAVPQRPATPQLSKGEQHPRRQLVVRLSAEQQPLPSEGR